MVQTIEGLARPPGDKRLGIVASRFNSLVVDALVNGALDTFRRLGIEPGRVDVIRVPGAFEIPLAAQALARTGRYAGLVCLGAVIQGETDHHDAVTSAATQGVARVMLESGIPVSHGILACATLEQALQRAGGKMGNKGHEAAQVVLEMADLISILGVRP
ncbi:MAG: 6,7-dimethyl-8-ribityllumazine synthase [Planctomycetota bacterium]|nr:6,7-dimethyl-8-ribityllumazine synthase [Planctomycetota bacterium]RLS40055.1 MAG: 6,7-dimethyl-8-ribityllumazine synthase [Planctomycetota bacterium]